MGSVLKLAFALGLLGCFYLAFTEDVLLATAVGLLLLAACLVYVAHHFASRPAPIRRRAPDPTGVPISRGGPEPTGAPIDRLTVSEWRRWADVRRQEAAAATDPEKREALEWDAETFEMMARLREKQTKGRLPPS